MPKRKKQVSLSRSVLLRQPKSHYMSAEQLNFFHRLLLQEHKKVSDTIESLRSDINQIEGEYDEADKASMEEENRLKFRMIERDVRLLKKIEQAIERIDKKQYGYCEKTGEPIGLKRLLLRPTTTFSIQAQTLKEKNKKD